MEKTQLMLRRVFQAIIVFIFLFWCASCNTYERGEKYATLLQTRSGYTSVSYSNLKNVYIAYDGKQSFLIDKKGHPLSSEKFDEIEAYEYAFPYARVMRDKKYGVVDARGKLIVPVQYDQVGELFSDMRGMYVLQNGKYHFFDRHGTLSETAYDSVCCFYYDCWENYFAAKRDGKWEIVFGDGTKMFNESWKTLSIELGAFRDNRLLLMGDGMMELFSKEGKKLDIPKMLQENYCNQKEFWWKPCKK
jgi:hypothetical protein